jgi:hypothetical protein
MSDFCRGRDVVVVIPQEVPVYLAVDSMGRRCFVFLLYRFQVANSEDTKSRICQQRGENFFVVSFLGTEQRVVQHKFWREVVVLESVVSQVRFELTTRCLEGPPSKTRHFLKI